jgi:cytochrome c
MKKVQTAGYLFSALLIAMMFSVAALAGETATKDECIAKVKEAVAMAKEKGLDAALQAVGDPKGPFVWKDSYVFSVSVDNATTLAHPINPKHVGKSMMAIKDPNGKMFFAEFAEVGASPAGEGWVDYVWINPNEQTPTPKHTYVMRVPGQNAVMCAGYY